MKFLFDFGISQEDPLSEQLTMDIHASDHILAVCSGGEVPLAFLCLNENISLTSVDVSETQLKLCRLKLLAAIYLDFPINGAFLGYSKLDAAKRNKIYCETLRPHLSDEDSLFWNQNISFIEKGIINAGRFEQYVKKMRFVAKLLIGKKNILSLIASPSLEEQKKIFHDHIAPRKSLQLLFKIAFHPSVYKKRGLQEQALIHAGETSGDRFYEKFQNFCVNSLASENYFLQYFLTANCINETAFPPYLQTLNKQRLMDNLKRFELINSSLQSTLCNKEKAYYNKIHLSNIGDWMNETEFSELMKLVKLYCDRGTRLCYRYLQKNHFAESLSDEFKIDPVISTEAEKKDRFPFYNILIIEKVSEI